MQVLSVVQRMPGLQKISFVAHSLGGLVARYAIGKLYEPPERSESKAIESNSLTDNHNNEMGKGRIAGLEPMNFITVATPHLGSGGHRQVRRMVKPCYIFNLFFSHEFHREMDEFWHNFV